MSNAKPTHLARTLDPHNHIQQITAKLLTSSLPLILFEDVLVMVMRVGEPTSDHLIFTALSVPRLKIARHKPK
jgi:hypothetical protein